MSSAETKLVGSIVALGASAGVAAGLVELLAVMMGNPLMRAVLVGLGAGGGAVGGVFLQNYIMYDNAAMKGSGGPVTIAELLTVSLLTAAASAGASAVIGSAQTSEITGRRNRARMGVSVLFVALVAAGVAIGGKYLASYIESQITHKKKKKGDNIPGIGPLQ